LEGAGEEAADLEASRVLQALNLQAGAAVEG